MSNCWLTGSMELTNIQATGNSMSRPHTTRPTAMMARPARARLRALIVHPPSGHKVYNGHKYGQHGHIDERQGRAIADLEVPEGDLVDVQHDRRGGLPRPAAGYQKGP